MALFGAILDTLAFHVAIVRNPHDAAGGGCGAANESRFLEDEDALAGGSQNQRRAHRAATAAHHDKVKSLVHSEAPSVQPGLRACSVTVTE